MVRLNKYIKFILIFIFSSLSHGAVIFVDNQLPDDCMGTYSITHRDNSGSDGDAYNTPQEAADASAPGDTIYFRAGTYYQHVELQDAKVVMTILTSGTAGNPITYTNYNGEDAIFSAARPGDDGHFNAVVLGVAPSGSQDISGTGVQYITIDGLIFEGASRAGLYICGPANKYGVAANPTEYVIVRNVIARNNIGVNGYGSGIKTIGTLFNCLIEDCECYGNWGTGIFLGRIDKDWHVPEPDDDMSAAHDTIVRNCMSHDNANTVAPGNTDGMGGSNMYHCTFENNVVYNNSDDGMDIYSSIECTIQNNFVFNHNTAGGNCAGIKFAAGSGGRHTVRSNVSYNNKNPADTTGTSFEGSKPSNLLRVYYPSRIYNNIALNCHVGIALGYEYTQTYAGYDKTFLYNNLSTGNTTHDIFYGLATYTDSDYNFWGNASDYSVMQGYSLDAHSITGDPGLVDIAFVPDVSFTPGWTLAQKLAYVRAQFAATLVPDNGSVVIDKGIIVTGYHDPSEGGSGGLVAWYSNAPDIGVYEYGGTPDPGNHAPVLAAIGAKSVINNELLTFVISATDADAGDTLTYSAINIPTGAGFNPATQTFTWTPTSSQIGTYHVTFRVNDGQVTVSETVTITVGAINLAPVLAAIGSKSVSENSLLSFTISATDPDGDALTYSATGLPTGATLSWRTFSWRPGYTQAGTHNVIFIASDGAAQDSETVTITVNNTNRAPVVDAIADKTASKGTLLTFGISATDPDGDAVAYSAAGLPTGATFADRIFNWTPSASHVGNNYPVTFTASDGQLNDSEIVFITVINDTSAPSVSNLSPAANSIQAPLNSLIILHVTDAGTGVDAGTVTITLDGNTIYTGDTSDYSSATGNCRRSGTNADYTYAYQSSQVFDFDESKTVTVNAADLGGNVMTERSYSFRTEMRSFGENTRVDSTVKGIDKAAPSTARDSSGNIWAVWHAGPAGSRDIYVAKLLAGRDTFSTSVRLTSSGADQANPALALGTDDKLYVVWQDNRLGDWDIYASTSVDGTNWSAQTRVNDPNEGNQVNPAIVVDGRSPNYAYVVWQDDRAGNQDICIATSRNSFVTKTVSQITSNTSNQTAPAIAVNSANTVYVLWTDARNASNDIYGAAGSPWTNVPIVTKAGSQSNPAIAVESAGSILHMLWVDQISGNSDIYYASSNGLPGSPLTGRNLIDDTLGKEQISPAIAVTGSTGDDLKVFACWHDERNVSGGTGDTDLYMVQTNSGIGTNVFVGDGETNSDQIEPAMSADQYGYPYLVWTDDRSTNMEIYFAGSIFMQPTALVSELTTASSGGTVGTDPGSLTDVDDVSVVLPAGACPYDATISITKIENQNEYHSLPCLNGYDFGPSGMVFNTPVTITIPYAVTSAAGTPTVYWYDSSAWYNPISQQGITNIETIVITSSLHALRFKTTHFTPFYVVLGTATDTVSDAVSSGGSGGGGGGGCSLSYSQDGSILEYFLPYGALALFMFILKKRRDRRYRKDFNKTPLS